jgi:hypothetical protein
MPNCTLFLYRFSASTYFVAWPGIAHPSKYPAPVAVALGENLREAR